MKISDEIRKAKKKAYNAAYKAVYNVANKEKIRAYRAAYRAAHRGENNAYLKAYYRAHKEQSRAYAVAYRAAHLEKITAVRKAHYIAHKKKIAAQQKAYRESHKQQLKAYRVGYRAKNRARMQAKSGECNRRRWASDPKFRLLKSLRVRVRIALKGGAKSASTIKLLGCTIPEWRAHLEARFRPGMTWENYGSVWHVDHRKPCSRFDLTDPEQQRACFHFSNTQPLFAKENLEKSDRVDDHQQKPTDPTYEQSKTQQAVPFRDAAQASGSFSGRAENY